MNEIGSGGGEAVLAPNRGGGEPHSSVEGILPADSIKESTRGTIKIWPEQATSHGPSAPHARLPAFSTTRPATHAAPIGMTGGMHHVLQAVAAKAAASASPVHNKYSMVKVRL